MRNLLIYSGRPLGHIRTTIASLLLALLCAGGCSPTLTSPPGRMMHLTTPASAGKGNTLVTGALGGGAEPFGPALAAGEVRARHGVSERADVGVAATAVGLVGESDLAAAHHRGVYALRAFTHYELVPRFVSLHAGLAGGGSAGGGFLSPDVGFTLGYENPHVVPYLFGAFFVSTPLTENTLEMREVNHPSDLRTPYLSFGPQTGTGMRIPIGPRDAPHGSILLEVGGMWLYGDDPAEEGGRDFQRGFVSWSVAYQAHFGRHAPLR